MSSRHLSTSSDALPRADAPPPVGGSPPGRLTFASRLASSASGSAGGVRALAARVASLSASSPPGVAPSVASGSAVATPLATVSSSSAGEVQSGGKLLYLVLSLLFVVGPGGNGSRLSDGWIWWSFSLGPEGTNWVALIMPSSHARWLKILPVMLITMPSSGSLLSHWGQLARGSFNISPLQPHLWDAHEFVSSCSTNLSSTEATTWSHSERVAYVLTYLRGKMLLMTMLCNTADFLGAFLIQDGRVQTRVVALSEVSVGPASIFGFCRPPRMVTMVSEQAHSSWSPRDQISHRMGLSRSPVYLQALLRCLSSQRLGAEAMGHHRLLADDAPTEWMRVRLESDLRRRGSLSAALSERAWLAVEPRVHLNVGQTIPTRIVRRPLRIFTDSTPARVYLTRMFATAPMGAGEIRMVYDGHLTAGERRRIAVPLYRPPLPLLEERPKERTRPSKRSMAWMTNLAESFM